MRRPWMTAVVAASSCLPFAQDIQATYSAKAGVPVSFSELPLLPANVVSPREYLLTNIVRSDEEVSSKDTFTVFSRGPIRLKFRVPANTSLIDTKAIGFHTAISLEKAAQDSVNINSTRAPMTWGTGITGRQAPLNATQAVGRNVSSHSASNSEAPRAPDRKNSPRAVSPAIVATFATRPSSTLNAIEKTVSNQEHNSIGIGAAGVETQPSSILPASRSLAPVSAGGLVGEVMAEGAIRSGRAAVATASDTQRRGEPTTSDGRVGPGAEPDPLLSSPGPQVKTLQQALARTYQTSPILMARRAELRGLDSAVAFERAASNPQIIAGARLDQELHITRPLGRRGKNLSANVDFSQVLFAGGGIQNSVRAARTRVIAGRADLRATEGDLLTEAVGAYADVLREREVRDLNLSQVRILQANLESTRARFIVRDLTLTDVAQSEARLVVAQSNLATAEGRLQASEEDFERVVGARAGGLEPLPPLPPLPMTSDQAVEATLANNADVAAFVARARAANYDVAATKSGRLPTLSVVGATDYDNALGTANSALGLPAGTVPNSSTNITAGFSLRFPLYQGGAVSARVRQAEEVRARLVEEAIAVERLAVANARTAFSIWRSSLTAISFNELAVTANEKALESVKVEQTVGARSILDVLNAEQELLSSQIALAVARRDAYVAAFELLNTMGAAEAADLNLEADPLYDPQINYRKYSDMWSDWADGPRRSPASTRNVPAEADSPLTRLNVGSVDESELDD